MSGNRYARKDGADSIIGAALDRWGPIDGLVNCAGVLRHRPFLDLTEADFDAVIASHLKGHFLTLHGVLTQMVKQGAGGSLIGISSGYVMGDPNRTPYRAAKAGIVALTKSMAMAGVALGRFPPACLAASQYWCAACRAVVRRPCCLLRTNAGVFI